MLCLILSRLREGKKRCLWEARGRKEGKKSAGIGAEGSAEIKGGRELREDRARRLRAVVNWE